MTIHFNSHSPAATTATNVGLLVGICVYLLGILLQLIFGVSCTHRQIDRQTDGWTGQIQTPSQTRQVLRLRLKFVDKLKTFSLAKKSTEKNCNGKPQSRQPNQRLWDASCNKTDQQKNKKQNNNNKFKYENIHLV